MNTKLITDEIAKLEREKIQLEMREQQLKVEKKKIEDALTARGVSVKDLDVRITQLREEVNTELNKLGLAHLMDTVAPATVDIDDFAAI